MWAKSDDVRTFPSFCYFSRVQCFVDLKPTDSPDYGFVGMNAMNQMGGHGVPVYGKHEI